MSGKADDGALVVSASTPLSDPRYIHSNIFERLIRNEDDLIGLVAYGLYQKKKRRWISKYLTDRGRHPTEQEVKDYCAIYEDPELEELRQTAQGVIYEVSEGLIQERDVEIQENAFNSRTTRELERLRSDISRISGYRHHVVGHIAGFFCLVILYVALTWSVNHEPSIVQFLRDAG